MKTSDDKKLCFGDREVVVIKNRPFGLVKVAYKETPDCPFYVDENFLTDGPQKENTISLGVLGGSSDGE